VVFASAGIFNPAGEGGGLPIEAAAATAVLGVVVNIADWQYRRTEKQVAVVYDVFKKVAEGAAQLAGNIWDTLNSPATPGEVNVRPVDAPPTSLSSKYVKARSMGGYYTITAVKGSFERSEILGSDSQPAFVDLIYDPLITNISSVGGWYVVSFRSTTEPDRGLKHYHFPGNISQTITWGSDPNVKPEVTLTIRHILPGLSDSVINDFDPFVGPVPGERTPQRLSPIVVPLPAVQPKKIPSPKPPPQPERKVVPPLTAPQRQPQPQRLPDQNPPIPPVKPQPATPPNTPPPQSVPVLVPQVTPIRTIKTNADGSRKTESINATATTPAGNEKIGPVTVTTNAPQATLDGIAGEVGRIEQKLAKMMRPPKDGDPLDKIKMIYDVAKAIQEAFFSGMPEGKFLFSSPCVTDSNGDRIFFEVPIIETNNRFDAILVRLDCLAAGLQTMKDIPQPICRGTQPTGQPVTVNFTQID
jgi:hypothetical protein